MKRRRKMTWSPPMSLLSSERPPIWSNIPNPTTNRNDPILTYKPSGGQQESRTATEERRKTRQQLKKKDNEQEEERTKGDTYFVDYRHRDIPRYHMFVHCRPAVRSVRPRPPTICLRPHHPLDDCRFRTTAATADLLILFFYTSLLPAAFFLRLVASFPAPP